MLKKNSLSIGKKNHMDLVHKIIMNNGTKMNEGKIVWTVMRLSKTMKKNHIFATTTKSKVIT